MCPAPLPSRASDSIAAVVTPPGQGGIGVVQVVGPDARAIVGRVFRGKRRKDLGSVPRDTLHYGFIVQPGPASETASPSEVIDEVIVHVAGPQEHWLGEPIVEVNCHGGAAAVRATLDAVVAAGAQRARWQDIPLRAFQRHSIDRVQLEARLEIPAAQTALAAQMLLAQLNGALVAAVQTGMDAGRGPDELTRLLGTARLGIALCRPPRVVIAGRPNVGKSTLFNTLLSEERALVHESPGTTRDYVCALVEIRGVPFELVDTAGMRPDADEVESAGIALARGQIAEADVVLLLVDGSAESALQDRDVEASAQGKPMVLVKTKADLPPGPSSLPQSAVEVSAVQGLGIEALERQILLAALGTDRPQCSGPVVFTARQRDCIERALSAFGEPACRQAVEDLLWAAAADGFSA